MTKWNPRDLPPEERYLESKANPNEEAARWRKVAHIVAAAYAAGVRVDIFLEMQSDLEGWNALASLVGIKKPSTTTVDQARAVVAHAHERVGHEGGSIPQTVYVVHLDLEDEPPEVVGVFVNAMNAARALVHHVTSYGVGLLHDGETVPIADPPRITQFERGGRHWWIRRARVQ